MKLSEYSRRNNILKNGQLGLIVTLLWLLASCSAAPKQTNTVECNGKNYSVTYMSEMQQYEVERFAMRNEFRPGCVSESLKQLKQQTCLSASSLSYQQWIDLYQSCIVENP
jgi:uncharacterized protein YkuJ